MNVDSAVKAPSPRTERRVAVVMVVTSLPGARATRAAASRVVMARNTSSRLGRRMDTTTPSAPGPAAVELVHRARAGRARCRRWAARAGASPSASCSSTTSPPIRAFSSAGGALGDDPAAVEHRDAVGEPVGLLEVLGREEDRRARSGERADDVPQLLPAAGVEPGRRLVEEQHRRRHDEAERQVEPTAHAAGVGADPSARGIREVESFEQLGGAACGPRDARAPRGGPSSRGSRCR